jgi:hypothetical protein
LSRATKGSFANVSDEFFGVGEGEVVGSDIVCGEFECLLDDMRNYTGVGSNAKHGTMVGDRNVSLDTDSLARRYFWVDGRPGSVGGHFAFS